jgi:methionine biosynthesis protein MetW
MAIYECVKKGLSVFHSDIESGLAEYPDHSFDYVILNQSMQEVKKIDRLIPDALRIGGKIIVGFPNFAFLAARVMLFFRGKAPITSSLPYRWYDTPNVRFLSVSDFQDFCREKNLKIMEAHYLGRDRTIRLWPNLLALNAIFVLTK